jgi:predicted ATPase/class 3 adenylate cyclase
MIGAVPDRPAGRTQRGPPTGVVTLLMTDIEGSTRLWEEYPEQTATALRRHDSLLRRAIEDNGGHVFKTVGDAFCAAFPSAREAALAAVTIQLALRAEPWPAPIELRVRMGLHTGASEERDRDYFGPVVNRAARLEAIAHGGQIVVSGVTTDLLDDVVQLRDLGQHRLKDLSQPERVFQIVIPGLDDEFPSLRSLDNPALTNNLPVQLTTFVGRLHEVEEVSALVEEHRLVTLTGAGGAGKTRLALQVAAELLDGSGDGVWFVDLGPVSDPQLVPLEVATSLGIRDEPGRAIVGTLLDALSRRRLLIVLDNCEHLVDACVPLVDKVLRACPEVHILATSRQALTVGGERIYRVPPLSLPDEGSSGASSEAVRLFLERSREHGQEVVLDEETAPFVTELCRRLDGMPLAIELACARLRSMTLEDLSARLDQRFALLTGGSRALMPRQRTLRGLIDWSYDLLSEPERQVLERLSVFAGSFDLDAADSVASTAEVEVFDIAGLVSSLTDKSLLFIDAETRSPRYRILETIREYAAAKLNDRGADAARSAHLAHAQHYLALAEEAAPQLRSRGQVMWLERLEAEYDNLRLAFRHLIDDENSDGEATRFAVALTRFWRIRHEAEGVDGLRTILGRDAPTRSTELQARALGSLASLLVRRSDQEARGCAEEALTISASLRQVDLRAELLITLTGSLLSSQNHAELDAVSQDALQAAHTTGNPDLIGRAHERRGTALSIMARPTDAAQSRTEFLEAIRWLRIAGDMASEAGATGNLAQLEITEGNYEAARDGWERAIAINRELGDDWAISVAISQLAALDWLRDDVSNARVHLKRSLQLSDRCGISAGFPYLFILFGLCGSRDGHAVEATLLFGASARQFDDLEITCEELEDRWRTKELTRLRDILGADFEATFERGRSMSITDACAIALADSPQTNRGFGSQI